MRRTALLLMVLFWALFGGSAVVGLAYGQSLDEADRAAATENLRYALDNNRAAVWVNPDTGNSGETLPVKTYRDDQGRYCREYVKMVVIGGNEEQAYGTACRQPDGTWRIITSGATSAAPVVVEKHYYPYNQRPYYSSFPLDLYLSFGYSHYSGHGHHRGHHYRGGSHYYGGKHYRGGRHYRGGKYYRGGKHFRGGSHFRGGKHFRGGSHFRGGKLFRGGKHFRGGSMRGGSMRGGSMRGGSMRGGSMRGGSMRGGSMRGGSMRGGRR